MAFKVITDFVPKPVLQMTCDRPCGIFANMVVEPEQAHDGRVHAAFMAEAQRNGWRANFEGHVCPQHVKKEAEEAQRIIVPEVLLARN